jgi:hypothetical protein
LPLHNLDNEKDTNNVFTLDRINCIPVPQQQITIYTGDWNLHHMEWSLDKTSRGQAEHHKTWLDINDLSLANTPGIPM